MWPAMTVIPGDTESGLAHSPLRLCHGWAHIRPVSLRRWQKSQSSPPPHVGKAAWPWQGKAGMLDGSELPLRPAEKHPVVIPSFHEQGSHWKQFPKPALSCGSGLCPHCCQVPPQAGTGPWHSPQSLPKVSQEGSWDSSNRKTSSWRTPSKSRSTGEGLHAMALAQLQKGNQNYDFKVFFSLPAVWKVWVWTVCTAAVCSPSWEQPSPHFLIDKICKQSLAVIDKQYFKRKQKPLQFHTWLRKVIQYQQPQPTWAPCAVHRLKLGWYQKL